MSKQFGRNKGDVMTKDDFIEVDSHDEILRREISAQKKIIDLPIQGKEMNTLSIICSYELFGLSKEDIAQVTGLRVDQVASIQMTEAYVALMNQIAKNIYEKDQKNLRAGFLKHSGKALKKIVELVEEADEDKVSLAAAQDLLDRAGFRPVDTIEHKHSFENELKIVHIKKNENENVPVIEAEFSVAEVVKES